MYVYCIKHAYKFVLREQVGFAAVLWRLRQCVSCLYFILIVSLQNERILTDISFDKFIVESVSSLFLVGNLVYVESGDVLLVSCKDKGSQDLPPDNLYNPRLQSIERHPVLSELNMNNRVLTIYDKFHPHQVEHLKKCFQNCKDFVLTFGFEIVMIFRQFYSNFCDN